MHFPNPLQALPLLLLPLQALAIARTTPPAGALVVGSGAQYKKVQDAVNALKGGNAATIFIQPGTYNEQVYIPATAPALTIYGSTPDTSSYTANTVTITAKSSISSAGNDDKSATLRAWSKGLKMYNVNVVNAYGKGEQAVALSAYGDQQGYYGCQFRGYQDTVLANQGKQVYGQSLIEGAT